METTHDRAAEVLPPITTARSRVQGQPPGPPGPSLGCSNSRSNSTTLTCRLPAGSQFEHIVVVRLRPGVLSGSLSKANGKPI